MALSDSLGTLQDVTGLWQVAGLKVFDSRLSQDCRMSQILGRQRVWQGLA